MFQATRYWTSNLWGATIAAIGGGTLMTVIAGIMLWMSQTPRVLLFAVGWVVTNVATFFCMFPGNLIAATPFAVELEDGKALRLYAPFKKLYIPIDQVREVKSGFLQQGTIVKLSKRHGLMKRFQIHWAFGSQRTQLARALEYEITRRKPG